MDSLGIVVLTSYRAGLNSMTLQERWAVQVSASLESWLAVSVTSISVVANKGSEPSISHDTKTIHVTSLDSEPKGALATAVMGLGHFDLSQGPLIVAAGDTEITDRVFEQVESFVASKKRAGVLVCESFDSATDWSFAHLDPTQNELLQVTERTQPTLHKTAGIFLFETVQTFLESAEWCFVNHIEKEEKFFTSSAVNYLLACGHSVFVGHLQPSDFKKMGKRP